MNRDNDGIVCGKLQIDKIGKSLQCVEDVLGEEMWGGWFLEEGVKF